MKRYVRISTNSEIDRIVNKAVRDVANTAYDNTIDNDANLEPKSFISGIMNDSTVQKYKILLREALLDAIDTQLRK